MLLYALEYVALSYIAMAILIRQLSSVRLPDATQEMESNRTLWALFVIAPVGIWIFVWMIGFAFVSHLLQPLRSWMLHEGEHDK